MLRRRLIVFFVLLLDLIILLDFVFLVNFDDDSIEDDYYIDSEVVYQNNGTEAFLIDRSFEFEDEIFDDENIVESQISNNHGKRQVIYECLGDLDCDDDFISENYCFFGKVYRDIHDYSCDIKCSEDTDRELVEVCDLSCDNGACVDFFEFDCTEDYECGISDFVGDRICVGDDVHQNYMTWTCENPGTDSSLCS